MDKQVKFNRPHVGVGSHKGMRSPENNDRYDFFEVERSDLAARWSPQSDSSTEKTTPLGQLVRPAADANGQGDTVYIAIVADGVTSTAGAAQASRIAVEGVKATLQEPPSRHETLSEWLEFAIVRAHEEIRFEAKRNPLWQEMSTTLVLAALAGEKLYVMHLGDSRAYLLRGGEIYQLTADHTWAQEAVNAGTISVEEASHHPGRNQLLRYLGAHKNITVDRGLIAPETRQREEYLTALPGDAILLCTDGLYRHVGAEAIKQIVLEHTGYPQDSVDDLIELAVTNGERDDITAVLFELPPARKAIVNAHEATAQTAISPATTTSPMSRITTLLLFLAVLLTAAFAFYWMVR